MASKKHLWTGVGIVAMFGMFTSCFSQTPPSSPTAPATYSSAVIPTTTLQETSSPPEQQSMPKFRSFSSCRAAKAAGAVPLYVGQPGYSSKLDSDGDGVACEK